MSKEKLLEASSIYARNKNCIPTLELGVSPMPQSLME